MTLVYILSDYEEQGANRVVATLDRDKLPALIDSNWPDVPHKKWDYAGWREEAKATLAEYLQLSEADLISPNGLNLHKGWGGAQLHVVNLP